MALPFLNRPAESNTLNLLRNKVVRARAFTIRCVNAFAGG